MTIVRGSAVYTVMSRTFCMRSYYRTAVDSRTVLCYTEICSQQTERG